MDLDKLIGFARAYRNLGWAIQEQVDDMLNGDYGDINPNALVEIEQHLSGYHDDFDEEIKAARQEIAA